MSDSLSEQVNIRIAGNDLPDAFNAVGFSNYDLTNYGQDGTFIDLTPYINEEYMPNLSKILDEHPDIRAAITMDDGCIYGLPAGEQMGTAGIGKDQDYNIYTIPQYSMINKAWLDELGLDIPVTYEDWETVLTAFKEKKGATAPLWIPSRGYMMDNSLSAGFQVTSDFFHIGDTVYYGPSQEGWKEYLTLLHRWYEKGLLDPNFMTGASSYPEKDMIESGAVGAWFHMYTMPSTFSFSGDTGQAEVAAVPPPKLHAGDEGHIRMQDSYVDSYFTITSSCEHPEVALRWLDYLFSEEGALLANYGVEGETYTLDEDGEPVYTEYMTQNPDGLTFSEAIMSYTYPPGLPSFYVDWQRECQSLPQKDVSMSLTMIICCPRASILRRRRTPAFPLFRLSFSLMYGSRQCALSPVFLPLKKTTVLTWKP